MPRVGAFEAWIECDDFPLEEYKSEQQGNAASCWVPSVADKDFVISVKSHESQATGSAHGKTRERIAVKLNVDGVDVNETKILNSGGVVSHLRGVNLDRKGFKAFRFSVISLTDGDDAGSDRVPDIGNLVVKFIRVRIEAKPNKGQNIRGTLPKGPIHESTTKGKAHRVQLAQPTVFPTGLTYKKWEIVKDYEDEEGPLAIIHFRYQPFEILQAHGIIEEPLFLDDVAEDRTDELQYPLKLEEEETKPRLKQEEEASPAPSSTLCEFPRSPTVELKKRKVERDDDDECAKDLLKKVKLEDDGGDVKDAVVWTDSIKKERASPPVDDIGWDELSKLMAERQAIEARITKLLMAQSKKVACKAEVKQEPSLHSTTYSSLPVAVSGVIDLSTLD